MRFEIRFSLASLIVAVLVLAASVLLLLQALAVPGIGSVFPSDVAWFLVVASALNLAIIGVPLARAGSGEGKEEEAVSARELTSFAWPVLLTVAIYLIGIYPGIFVFTLLYAATGRKLSVVQAAIVAIVFTAAAYGIFDRVLGVRPFSGLLL